MTPVQMTLELVDATICKSVGLLEDVPVRIGECWFPYDFVVIDIGNEKDLHLILSRPFLATARIKCDFEKGQVEVNCKE